MVVEQHRRRALADVAALVWLVLLAALLLAPALAHGSAIGPSDVLRELGLTSQPNAVIHNPVGSDEIEEFVPWQMLAWLQVHAGHFPIWNPDSVLGMPLAFNLQSAPFSLPVALGYLFPLGLEHTVAIVARLLIGGSGMYVLGRVLGLRPLPAVFGASIFELSGAYTVWLGAYESGCLGFAGWVLAASVLVVRQRRRPRAVVLLAVSLALALAGGEPQIAIVLLGCLAVFATVLALGAARHGPSGVGRRVVLDHLAGTVAALGLVAPLYLPATQLGLISGRAKSPGVSNLPLYDLTHLVFAGYNGVPTDVNDVIGPNDLYVAMIYVGVIALVLGAVAFTDRRRRTFVLATAAMGTATLVALFVPLVPDVFRTLPLLRVFRLDLATPMLDAALALLAAFGTEALLSSEPVADGGAVLPRRSLRPPADRVLAGGSAAVALLLAVLGARLMMNVDHLDRAQSALRTRSFLWPTLSLAALIIVLVVRGAARRRGAGSFLGDLAGRGAVAGLLVLECAFLVFAGEAVPTSASQPVPPTPAITRLAAIVGANLVGIGSCQENAFPNAGILPNVNLAYGIEELSVYDPILPSSYYHSYGAETGRNRRVLWPHVFCPAITSVGLARFYGVAYILEPPGLGGPKGTTHVATLHGEGLYRVPGSGRATLQVDGHSVVLAASQPTPGTWRIVSNGRRRGELLVRVTSVPGWQASIDGRPLALRTAHQLLLGASVPAGHHVIVLRYWPRLLTIGLVLAVLAGGALLGALVGEARQHRARRGSAPSAPAGSPRDALAVSSA